ncbi:MAG: hypothetical protein IPM54_37600 [Polyangiaceae bacterium]|nr:hypothetical protein [Polyangiaceae bacterium]
MSSSPLARLWTCIAVSNLPFGASVDVRNRVEQLFAASVDVHNPMERSLCRAMTL